MMKSLSFSAFLVLPSVLCTLLDVQSITAALVKDARVLPPVSEVSIPRGQVISQTTSPKTYYVSGDGSDTNNGLSTASPFRTIQKAADLTNPGDRVFIMNGLYTNPHSGFALGIRRSGAPNAWITYKAYPGHKPKIKHNSWNGILIRDGVSYIEIDGLEIEGNNANISLEYALSQKTNTSTPLTNGNCITVDGSKKGYTHHIRILNNKVHGCGGAGIAIIKSDYVRIHNNEVFNNCWYSALGNSGISLYQSWNSDNNQGYKIFVTNNKIYNNRQYIPWYLKGSIQDGHGLIIDDFDHFQSGLTSAAYKGRTYIANNITYKNGGSGIIAHRSDHIDIVNNVSYLNNQSPEITHGQIIANISEDVNIVNNILYAFPGKKVNNNHQNINVTYDYNIYANSSNIAVKGPNDIVADPQFVNPANGDFRLQADSPGIDKGLKWNVLTTDFAGNPRPSGTRFDIGAYEYQF